MLYQLAIETEPDECGFHSVVVDISDDAVLFVTDSHNTPEQAERQARDWINKHA
jgi:hypothetical protein